MPPVTSIKASTAGRYSTRSLPDRINDASDSLRRTTRQRRARTSGTLTTPPNRPGHEKLRHKRKSQAKTIQGGPPTSPTALSRPSSSCLRPAVAPPTPPKRRHMDVEVNIGRPPLRLAGDEPVVSVGLPRKLLRPDWKDISREAKQALHPGLADVPANYIREKLLSTGLAEGMFKVIQSVQCAPVTTATLPNEISLTLNHLGGDLPTHVFAVYAPHQSDERQKVTLHPSHNMILSSHCTNLPPLKNTPEAADCDSYDFDAQHAVLRVPVVPLMLPHPPTFPHISHYLYTKKAEPLMAALLPPQPPADPVDEDEEEEEEERDENPRVRLAQRLARAYEPRRLLAHAMVVNGLWRNAVALGIFDEKMWMTMDVAWDVILTALRIASPSEAAAHALAAAAAQKPVEPLIPWAPGHADRQPTAESSSSGVPPTSNEGEHVDKSSSP